MIARAKFTWDPKNILSKKFAIKLTQNGAKIGQIGIFYTLILLEI